MPKLLRAESGFLSAADARVEQHLDGVGILRTMAPDLATAVSALGVSASIEDHLGYDPSEPAPLSFGAKAMAGAMAAAVAMFAVPNQASAQDLAITDYSPDSFGTQSLAKMVADNPIGEYQMQWPGAQAQDTITTQQVHEAITADSTAHMQNLSELADSLLRPLFDNEQFRLKSLLPDEDGFYWLVHDPAHNSVVTLAGAANVLQVPADRARQFGRQFYQTKDQEVLLERIHVVRGYAENDYVDFTFDRGDAAPNRFVDCSGGVQRCHIRVDSGDEIPFRRAGSGLDGWSDFEQASFDATALSEVSQGFDGLLVAMNVTRQYMDGVVNDSTITQAQIDSLTSLEAITTGIYVGLRPSIQDAFSEETETLIGEYMNQYVAQVTAVRDELYTRMAGLDVVAEPDSAAADSLVRAEFAAGRQAELDSAVVEVERPRREALADSTAAADSLRHAQATRRRHEEGPGSFARAFDWLDVGDAYLQGGAVRVFDEQDHFAGEAGIRLTKFGTGVYLGALIPIRNTTSGDEPEIVVPLPDGSEFFGTEAWKQITTGFGLTAGLYQDLPTLGHFVNPRLALGYMRVGLDSDRTITKVEGQRNIPGTGDELSNTSSRVKSTEGTYSAFTASLPLEIPVLDRFSIVVQPTMLYNTTTKDFQTGFGLYLRLGGN